MRERDRKTEARPVCAAVRIACRHELRARRTWSAGIQDDCRGQPEKRRIPGTNGFGLLALQNSAIAQAVFDD